MAELPPFRSAFSDVDASGAGNQLIDYLDAARRAPAIVDAKTWSFEVLDLEPGMRTLDVGCGTSEGVMVMAEQVQPNGRAVGIDLSATMIEEATRAMVIAKRSDFRPQMQLYCRSRAGSSTRADASARSSTSMTPGQP